MSIFTDISGLAQNVQDFTQESGRHYQVVLAKDFNGVQAGTVFGEYCSYYSANLAAEDSEFADYLAIHDLRQGKM